jgi:spermidine synthase
MRRWGHLAFYVVFTLTGFSALVLQVVWQRVISVHAGVDLVSFTTVVAAFLAGLGLGSLVGGWVADRIGARGSVLLFALSNLAVGLFAWLSTWLFYDFYEQHASSLGSPYTKFAFNFVLLFLPTILMGLSLPLVAKGVVERITEAGSMVGRMYAVNTFGAAVGAALAGWVLLGTYGFVATTRIAGAAKFLAAALMLVVYAVGMPTAEVADAARSTADPATSRPPPAAAGHAGAVGSAVPWYLVYGLTGAVALGFEVVFFRLIDTIMRSNSYSFAHVLAMYLFFFAIGSAVASPIAKRTRRPDQWFLWAQFAVGITALAGPIILTKVLPHGPWKGDLQDYFYGEGFEVGFVKGDGSAHTDFVHVFFGVPLLIMGLPVMGMGASFPFVQSLVSQRMESLGRHTGLLLFSNITGNVLGTLVVGFIIIDRFGTSGTYRLLGLALLAPALAATWTLRGSWPRRVTVGIAALLLMAMFVRFFPSNDYLYASLHGVDMAHINVAEDRSCSNALRLRTTGEEEMTVNGATQNNYPFDDFHVLLGLTPALMHADPQGTMALGLGIGATPYGLSLDPRVDKVHAVEICGPQVPLLEDLGARRAPELRAFFANPRLDVQVGDGRDYLLRTNEQLDVVIIDTLRQHAAYSGNVYSKEFYQLVHDRLSDDGFLAEWVPTGRTLNSVLEVFPYVSQFQVRSYHDSVFFVASKKPIVFDREQVLRRFGDLGPDSGLSPAVAASARTFFETTVPLCPLDPTKIQPVTDDAILNHDLFPRDEYFLNQEPGVLSRHVC